MNIRDVARLARLRLSDEEAATYQTQLDGILAYVEHLKQVDVSGIEPTAHASPVYDVMREDLAREDLCLSRDAVLANAPAVYQDQFRLPKVVES